MSEGVVISGLILVTIALIILAFIGVYKEEEEWKLFVETHKCRVIGHKKGQVTVGSGVSSSGNPIVITGVSNDQTLWICDDGLQYWR